MGSKKITKIEVQERNPKRFNIYLDNNYSFSVHEDVLVSNRIVNGQIIDEDEDYIKDIIQEEEKNKTLQKALKYLAHRPRTKKEIKSHLLEKGFELDNIISIINKLEKEKIIDDYNYASEFISQRISSNPKGRMLIFYELKKKGIDEEIINQAIETSYDSNLEFELANKLIRKKEYKFIDKDNLSQIQSISSLLERRGFSYEVINSVINDYKAKFKI